MKKFLIAVFAISMFVGLAPSDAFAGLTQLEQLDRSTQSEEMWWPNQVIGLLTDWADFTHPVFLLEFYKTDPISTEFTMYIIRAREEGQSYCEVILAEQVVPAGQTTDFIRAYFTDFNPHAGTACKGDGAYLYIYALSNSYTTRRMWGSTNPDACPGAHCYPRYAHGLGDLYFRVGAPDYASISITDPPDGTTILRNMVSWIVEASASFSEWWISYRLSPLHFPSNPTYSSRTRTFEANDIVTDSPDEIPHQNGTWLLTVRIHTIQNGVVQTAATATITYTVADPDNPFGEYETPPTGELTDASIECAGQFFDRSLCKMMVFLFKPSPTGLMFWQRQLDKVKGRVPFAYVYHTHEIVGGISATPSQTAFSLPGIRFGNSIISIPILSSAASTNLAGADEVGQFRSVIKYALWILLVSYFFVRFRPTNVM